MNNNNFHETFQRPIINHHIVEIFDVEQEVFKNSENIVCLMEKFIEANSLKPLNTLTHRFSSHSVTIMYVLSSSHLVLHTWPELRYIHLDVMRCDEVATIETIRKLRTSAEDIFQSSKVKVSRIIIQNR